MTEIILTCVMMTSSNGNIFRVTGPVEFPTQRPVTRSFDVLFICVWINGWVNNRKVGDLRRHRGHYDVTVMFFSIVALSVIRLVNNHFVDESQLFSDERTFCPICGPFRPPSECYAQTNIDVIWDHVSISLFSAVLATTQREFWEPIHPSEYR